MEFHTVWAACGVVVVVVVVLLGVSFHLDQLAPMPPSAPYTQSQKAFQALPRTTVKEAHTHTHILAKESARKRILTPPNAMCVYAVRPNRELRSASLSRFVEYIYIYYIIHINSNAVDAVFYIAACICVVRGGHQRAPSAVCARDGASGGCNVSICIARDRRRGASGCWVQHNNCHTANTPYI